MTTIYKPADAGFDVRLDVADRAGLALLRELAAQYGLRLTLKGGMAMRVAFGSSRLTRDLDFDRDASLSLDSLGNGLPRALERAARSAGIAEPKAEITKRTGTTVRARLTGRGAGAEPVRIEIEISGRLPLPTQYRRPELVVTPQGYGMAPFTIQTYTNDALAATKALALMAPMRNVPRDVYDLHKLVLAGADAAALLAEIDDPAHLKEMGEGAFTKVGLIGFELAKSELLPYLPLAEREAVDEDAWLEMCLAVAQAVEQWAGMALDLRHGAAAKGARKR